MPQRSFYRAQATKVLSRALLAENWQAIGISLANRWHIPRCTLSLSASSKGGCNQRWLRATQPWLGQEFCPGVISGHVLGKRSKEVRMRRR
jgi:hypothetical protein